MTPSTPLRTFRRRIVSPYRRMVCFISLCMLIYSVIAGAQPPANSHLEIESIRGHLRMNSVRVTIHCIADSKFTDGSITCKVGKLQKKAVDTLSLWSGNSDSESFDHTYYYILQLEKGKKGRVEVSFVGHITGMGSRVMSNRAMYAYRLADTLLTGEESYAALDKSEVDYLIRKKGYDQKSEDEIKTLDPDLWNKMQKVKKDTPAQKQ